MPKTPQQMIEAVKRNLPKNTGKTFEEWIRILKKKNFRDKKEAVNWLKGEHNFGTNQANFVAGEIFGHPDYMTKPEDQLLSEQYNGDKAHLREIFDHLVNEIKAVCPEISTGARKTYVSLTGKTQFGIIQASTKNRIDIGLKITGIKYSSRVLEPGSFYNDKVTCKVGLTGVEDVDGTLIELVKKAFEENLAK